MGQAAEPNKYWATWSITKQLRTSKNGQQKYNWKGRPPAYDLSPSSAQERLNFIGDKKSSSEMVFLQMDILHQSYLRGFSVLKMYIQSGVQPQGMVKY